MDVLKLVICPDCRQAIPEGEVRCPVCREVVIDERFGTGSKQDEGKMPSSVFRSIFPDGE